MMVTTALIKFMLGIFSIFFIGWICCVIYEYVGSLVEYADKQAQKKIAYREAHKVDEFEANKEYWLNYYFGEEVSTCEN